MQPSLSQAIAQEGGHALRQSVENGRGGRQREERGREERGGETRKKSG